MMIYCKEDIEKQSEEIVEDEEYDYMNEPPLEEEEFEYEEDEREYCD